MYVLTPTLRATRKIRSCVGPTYAPPTSHRTAAWVGVGVDGDGLDCDDGDGDAAGVGVATTATGTVSLHVRPPTRLRASKTLEYANMFNE